MTPFEEELKRALARQESSADFTSRVLAAVSARPSAKPAGPRANKPNWMWQWAAAAAAILVFLSATFYQHHEREVQGEAAKQKLMVALHIAGSKLHEAQERVQEVGEVSQ